MAESFASSSTQTGRSFRPPTASPPPLPRVHVHTLGCKVNQVDSEAIRSALRESGFEVVSRPDDADYVVVNTCTVTAESDKKARKALRHFATLGQHPRVVATGCMVAVSPDTADALHERVCVVSDKEAVAAALLEQVEADSWMPGRATARSASPESDAAARDMARTRVQMKAQDGCDGGCTYCIVPAARGASTSVSLHTLGETARRLAAAGVHEIVLTGIDLGSYADDDHDLADVISRVSASGIDRVRLSSVEPMHLSERLIETLASTRAFCRHLHVPLQSGADRILGEMGRPYRSAAFLETIAGLRRAMPDLAVTTDLMVGFPSESEEDFDESMRVCREAGFAKTHVFRYSPRPGTHAAERNDQIPPGTVKERSARARELATELRSEFIDGRVGEVVEILTERTDEGPGRGWAAGTSREYIKVRVPEADAVSGEILSVRLLERTDEGALGEVVGEG